MKSRRHKSTIAALAAAALLALPGVANGTVDYSKNSVNGRYAGDHPSVQTGPKDYSQNASTGDYAETKTPPVQLAAVADDDGFAWGAAGIGAGVTLALALIALGTTVIRRRRIASPAT